jgi:hypothetical protein
MAQEVMAVFDAKYAEAAITEGCDEVGAGNARNPAHAAIVTRWMPMNSKSRSGVPLTSLVGRR